MLRSFTTTFFLFLFLSSFAQTNLNSDAIDTKSIIKVTLLGTGTPQPIMERFGASTLVQAGGKNLLFDTGRGCLQRLRQIGVEYNTLDGVFFTHLHSDHIVGFPDLWLTGWLVSKRTKPLSVFGPDGTKQMIAHLQEAYQFDIDIREEDDKASPEGCKLSTTDIQEGTVYDQDGVKVIAFLVDHYPIVPAFGYRIEFGGHSAVLSGDTRYSENLIKYAKGTDLLVHEVAIASDTLKKSNPRYNILAHHTTPEQAAKVFTAVKPKLAVYSHIVRLYGYPEEEILRRTKEIYTGPVLLGEDLMSFSIGDSVSINHIE
ncbi:MAG TPA: MBL fold metallo-hydrolase [Bacteroidales bacterium]|jgi:ribonuclease Z|nr:MBL fold metallo-hydrolase [Bacteroidales bacterium]